MTTHICKQEHVLGSHTEQLKSAARERAGLMDAIKNLTDETKKISFGSISADHILSESFVRIETLLGEQVKVNIATTNRQNEQDALLHSIDSNIKVMRNDVNNISVDIGAHKQDSKTWRDAIEIRLKKLESIRIFVYAFCLILVIVAALVVRVSDTWTAIDKLKDKKRDIDDQIIELEEDRILPRAAEPIEPIKLPK